jgi:hypothetical protein
MRLITYQALLANQQNIDQVKRGRGAVERVGGRVEMAPPTKLGIIVVILHLPEGISPEQFFPGVPFYPM